MWRLKVAEGGRPWLRTLNNHVGRQVWEFDPHSGSPQDLPDIETARRNFHDNRFTHKHNDDLLMRLQFAKENPVKEVIPVGVVPRFGNLSSMVTDVWGNDNNLQLEAMTQSRKLFSIERIPPIEEIIQTGVVSRFVEFLMREYSPQLQFETTWALTKYSFWNI